MTHPHDLLRACFNVTTDALVLVADGRTGTVVDGNEQVLAATGYRRDELDGAPLDRVMPAAAAVEALPLVESSPDVYLDGVSLLTKSGDGVAVDARITPLAINGLPHVMIVARRCGTPPADRSRPPDAASAAGDVAPCPGIIGESEPVRRMCELIRSVAHGDTTVLIQGESGTGKELVASAIHGLSRRARGPFVKVNCAALTETLLESELFGHVKGAFTGAMCDRAGRFKQAHRGTILLDEIGSMPLSGQAALLRVLQEREFEPVGSSATTAVDVRVLAATNGDLAKAVADGTFRADLYYRLHVFGITVPPLRERADDIPGLARHFLRQVSETLGKPIRDLTPPALAALGRHAWPGNVRELENAMEHAAIVESGRDVTPSSLPMSVHDPRERESVTQLGLRERLNLIERQILVESLVRANGIRKHAAAMLGIDSRNMPYFLRKHRLLEASRS